MSTVEIPDEEALVEILSAPGAPPRLMLDLEGSDGDDLHGIVYVTLDSEGRLVVLED